MPLWIILVIVAASIATFALLLVLLYYFALPQLILHKMRTSENPDGEMTYPDNFNELKEKTRFVKDLTYPSASPSNAYNLYFPLQIPENKKIPLIVWIHGGGFIGGSKDGGDNVMTALCAAGYAVASVDYAVAPKHKYPTAVRQVAEFSAHLSEVLQQYPFLDGDKIILGGDSAGAQIAAQFTAAQTNPALAREMNLPTPLQGKIQAVVLVCGPFNLPGIRAYANKTNKMFRRLVDIWGRVYFGKLFWYKSRAAMQTVVPDHVTQSFPAAFLTDGNKGSFELQNRKLAEKLRSLNVPVEELYFEAETGDVPHEYLFHLHEENSQICMERILSFLAQNVPG